MKMTNKQLLKENQNLQTLLLEAQSLLAKKEATISTLLEQLKLARHQRFSPTSEKQSPQQDELFDEAEHLVSAESPKMIVLKMKKILIRPRLPRKRSVVALYYLHT